MTEWRIFCAKCVIRGAYREAGEMIREFYVHIYVLDRKKEYCPPFETQIRVQAFRFRVGCRPISRSVLSISRCTCLNFALRMFEFRAHGRFNLALRSLLLCLQASVLLWILAMYQTTDTRAQQKIEARVGL